MKKKNIRAGSIALALATALCSGVLPVSAAGTADPVSTEQSGYIDLTGKTEYNGIKLATGATVTADALQKDQSVNIEDFGAVALEDRKAGDTDTHACENTEAINAAIQSLKDTGGTVVIPEGTFRSYTVDLEDNVNLHLEKGAVLQAAKADCTGWDGKTVTKAEDTWADGTPGNYDQPEVNLYTGLQDNGHTYFANSLLYAADKKNIMIYGEGLIDGSQMNSEGTIDQVLQGSDPSDPSDRTASPDPYYGNKTIALVRCENVVLSGINILNGGHFAIINEGTRNMLVDHVIVDTNRDAFNIDCGQDVTIRDSRFNSLTDDAIVFKASYGAGIMQPVQNCLVENCVVSGYDAGSVIAGTYTTDKQVATDLDGPTARIKFGTESTCGYNTVTINNVRFDRSRGFCMESVDGNAIHDILMVNAYMDTISSSPIYIRIGNRGRYPVTGKSTDTAVAKNGTNERESNSKWVLPNTDAFTKYPIQRYFPEYNYIKNAVTMSNGTQVSIVDPADPAKVNDNNFYTAEDGTKYLYKWNEQTQQYEPDLTNPIPAEDQNRYGSAVGYSDLATAYNIYVGNVIVRNCDPRYPITLAGLVDSKIRNVTFENIDVIYRGGLRMQDAVEQQLIFTDWEYTQYKTAPSTQKLPWLSNTFFSKNSSLLPRVIWNGQTSSWDAEPYAVPEMAEQYPEPTNFGILPAYGIYARHVDGLTLKNVKIGYEVEDGRNAVVLDDCANVIFDGFTAQTADGVTPVMEVTNNYKRHTGFEYIPEEPYIATTCSNITGLSADMTGTHVVNTPEPGTPADSLYNVCTIASTETGYSYGENAWTYNGKTFSLPVTVHRPFFEELKDQTVKAGEMLSLTISARNPAAETAGIRDQAASDATLVYSAQNLPEGASFDPATHVFTFTPAAPGTWTITFVVDDGVLPVTKDITITAQ